MIDKDCSRCKLSRTRTQVVLGKGNPFGKILLVGEAAGATEDEWGMAFVGDAGTELTSIMAEVGWSLDDCWVDNLVRCRPPNNRDPEPDEISACSPYLEQQIALAKPRLIVALGQHAARHFLKEGFERGIIHVMFRNGQLCRVLPLYHPAWLLYSKQYDMDKKLYLHHIIKNQRFLDEILR